ncbi:MAG: carbamoyltransferase HypF [Hyphomicrobium sp.]
MPVNVRDLESRSIRITGLVQGVGFRPTVWRLAREEGVTGFVLNDGSGVRIEATGLPAAIDRLCQRIRAEAPPLARIERVEMIPLGRSAMPSGRFEIRLSVRGDVATGIVPDAATCPVCVAECFEPSDRRYRYPFTNCTHCGPRLSIVEAIPYDRQTTTMAPFRMCLDCRREYDAPEDRRFHAQPNACPVCGPKVWLEGKSGGTEPGDPIDAGGRLIGNGMVIAIKGIGGFHLACDATDEAAVSMLRKRKSRDSKPFALMARDVEMVRSLAQLSADEAEMLGGSAAPIVLLQRRADARLAKSVAPGQSRIGIMLPYTPLHHLLLSTVGRPLVMTSGNRSTEPQCVSNADAGTRLVGLADAVLMHDRGIANRLDDSVARIDSHGPTILRRARGFAPAPVPLAREFSNAPATLALGGELKSTFCLVRGGSATLSQHLGDLDEPETCADFRKTLERYLQLYDFAPEVIAIDKHPDYATSTWGTAMARDLGIPLAHVQHHHAHLAAVLAENAIEPDCESALGIILDGTGLGQDTTIWGGEFLLGGYRSFERVGHLAAIGLPGGAAAVREPWRNLYAHLSAAGISGISALHRTHPTLGWLREKPIAMIEQMLARGINAPLASSAGRLFDAVAAVLGVCRDLQSYEGQAAMELECLAEAYISNAAPYPFAIRDGTPTVVSFAPMWPALLRDIQSLEPTGLIAARFHRAVISAIARTVEILSQEHRIGVVALSGGVFQNRLLVDGVGAQLERMGLRVLRHRRVPANDGGLSLGQATIAAALGLTA